METLLLGIDKGTTMTKAVLFDRRGVPLAVASAASPGAWPRPGWHEEDPEQAWAQVGTLVRQVMISAGARPDQVTAIGVTAHMSGLVLLDGAGRPVRPNILWDDSRAASILAGWEAQGLAPELFEISGQAFLAGLTLPLLAWMQRHEPDALARARWLMTTKDYFVYRLTGEVGTDESDAGWMPGDVRARTHSGAVQELCGVAAWSRLFPAVRRPGDVVGWLTTETAADLGLAAGTPVVAGLGDANAATVGAGVIAPGQAVSIIGTSLLNNIVLDAPQLAPHGIGFLLPTVCDRWLRMLPNTGGGAVNIKWLVDTLYAAEHAAGGGSVYRLIDSEVGGVAPGAGGVIYHPYVSGAGVVAPFYHLGARGQFFGLSTASRRPELARAVYEGIALSIKDCYSAAGVPVGELRLSGGAARSGVLCQIVADAVGAPVHVPAGEETAALGVALVAGVGAGVYGSLGEAITQAVRLERSYAPDPARTDRYAEILPLFVGLREATAEMWSLRQRLFPAGTE
ncbi:MAG TPA: FGGY-family carbohydrate kinase [Symbiobacteriaceae bacterium]|nr:FGGY-family carbohydrate kinase [Symbiobacteriaceae bacterium]